MVLSPSHVHARGNPYAIVRTVYKNKTENIVATHASLLSLSTNSVPTMPNNVAGTLPNDVAGTLVSAVLR